MNLFTAGISTKNARPGSLPRAWRFRKRGVSESTILRATDYFGITQIF